MSPDPERADEWVWGWDPTPGIVSVWAEPDGRAYVWRRVNGALVRDDERYRPWILLPSLADLSHLGRDLRPHRRGAEGITYTELRGAGALRFVVSAGDARTLSNAVLRGCERRLGRSLRHLRQLGDDEVCVLPPEEQYLVATGRTYFRDLAPAAVRRLQLDIETTGLDASHDRVFLVALRSPEGVTTVLEARGAAPSDEADLIGRVVALVHREDPDVIENHNLHGFDLPFLARRARAHGVSLDLGRFSGFGLRERPARRGFSTGDGDGPRRRYTVPGRELFDTMDAVRSVDFATRELPSHGLKAVARHLGVAAPDREHVRGHRIYEEYLRDPVRVRRYATHDVEEVAAVSRLLGGASFALARMAPRRYERLADAGPATGVLDPMLLRAYMRSKRALPERSRGDGTPHKGAALHLFSSGVARRIVKADVASLYPSLMRAHGIGPSCDELGALLAIVDRLVVLRLSAKKQGREAPRGSPERYEHEATSAAMKLVVNSAYGYLAAVGLVRFSDVHAANEVTRRGRETLALMCRELERREVVLLEADTDGVYFSVPESFTEADERRVVAEVAALLPDLVKLELDGRYAAMLSHEPKNYALLGYDGALTLRGVAFRSSRAEPFGEAFLRRALACLLSFDVRGTRQAYVATALALRHREIPTRDVAMLVRLTKTPAEYASSRRARRELAYEALLAAGRTEWTPGERVHVYRDRTGRPRLAPEADEDELPLDADARDYDVDHYVRVLRGSFVARLERAFSPEDFSAVFDDPEQPTLFTRPLSAIVPVLERADPAGFDEYSNIK